MSGATPWSHECVALSALSSGSISYPSIIIPADNAGLFFASERLVNTLSELVVFVHGGFNASQRRLLRPKPEQLPPRDQAALHWIVNAGIASPH